MGLSSAQSYNRLKLFKERIADIFSMAISYKLTHSKILEHRTLKVFCDPRYSGCPLHVKEYLRGYWDAQSEGLYKNHLEWRHWVPAHPEHPDIGTVGKLLTKEQVRTLQTAGWTDIHQHICKGNPTEDSSSTYTWKGFPDKPF